MQSDIFFNKAFLFIILTFFLSWILIIMYFIFVGQWVMPGSLIISTAYMFIPLTVTILLQKVIYKEDIKKSIGVLMMIVFTLLLSPIFSYVRLKAKSVLAAAIIHGSLNASIGLPLMILKGGNDLTTGITGLSGFAALLMINLVLFIYDYYFSNEKIMSKNIH